MADARDTRAVLDDHLRLRRAGDLEADLDRNYHPDVSCLSLTGGRHGHDGVRAMAAELEGDLPDATFDYEELVVDGEFGLLGWTGGGQGTEVLEGADAFVVRDGWIVAQIVHYHVHH